ncbi:MAG: flagellar hook-associated protein FlgK [Candidatus Thiodiazotropha sp. (ex Monitilora ramsayi)]|nr:flagellar hook-associated protein FlgK [Candidatus Thiodiazotropha sp. (ex Monitilora ramsayi)]
MSILSIGVSALTANRQALDTTGHNIANVNTEGYSRQRVDFVTRQPDFTGIGYLGNGVETSAVTRQYDQFISSQVRASQSVTSELQAYFDGARQLDDLVADPDVGLQPTVQNFFNALQALADDPASVSARQLVLAEGESMVDRFHYFDRQFESARSTLNEQINASITEINRLAEDIATINNDIKIAYGSAPNDLLDKRDQLVNDLSELVDIQVLQQSDGAYNVFIGKGQPLVMAYDAATMTTQPSTLDPTHLEIAFNFPFGTQIVTDQISGGRIGGLLRYREEILDPAQNQVGLVALGLANDLNTQHQLGLDLDGLAGTALFASGTVDVLEPPGNGSSITVTYNDIGNLTANDYQLLYNGTDFILENLSDGSTQTLAAGLNTVDGLDININAAGAVAGDTFLIQPTRNASASLDLLISDSRRLAAASPLQLRPATDAAGNALNTGDAKITQPANSSTTGLPLAADMQLVYNAAAGGFDIVNGPGAPDNFIAYDATDPAVIIGVNYPTTANPTQFDAFGGISFSISGVPADGDTFLFANNTSGTSDNRNALGLVDLQTMDRLRGGTATYDETYAQMVSDVGSKTHHAELNLSAQESLLNRTREAMQEVSGVNLDEEAAKLIQFQQAYQASAQIISAANTLFDTLISAVRR